jgi:hypothetical protein
VPELWRARRDQGLVQLVGRGARSAALQRGQGTYCRTQYNGETGGSLTMVAIVYGTVVFVVFAWLGHLWFSSR